MAYYNIPVKKISSMLRRVRLLDISKVYRGISYLQEQFEVTKKEIRYTISQNDRDTL